MKIQPPLGLAVSVRFYHKRDAPQAPYPPIIIGFNEDFAISAVTMRVLHIPCEGKVIH